MIARVLGHVLQLRHGSTKPHVLVPPASGVLSWTLATVRTSCTATSVGPGLLGGRHVVHLTGAQVKRCNGGGCAGKKGGRPHSQTVSA